MYRLSVHIENKININWWIVHSNSLNDINLIFHDAFENWVHDVSRKSLALQLLTELLILRSQVRALGDVLRFLHLASKPELSEFALRPPAETVLGTPIVETPLVIDLGLAAGRSSGSEMAKWNHSKKITLLILARGFVKTYHWSLLHAVLLLQPFEVWQTLLGRHLLS